MSCASKVKAVHEWPRPQTVKHIRAFLGLAGYYSMYMRGFAEIAVPLRHLQKKDVEFIWGPVQEQAFILV